MTSKKNSGSILRLKAYYYSHLWMLIATKAPYHRLLKWTRHVKMTIRSSIPDFLLDKWCVLKGEKRMHAKPLQLYLRVRTGNLLFLSKLSSITELPLEADLTTKFYSSILWKVTISKICHCTDVSWLKAFSQSKSCHCRIGMSWLWASFWFSFLFIDRLSMRSNNSDPDNQC